MSSLTPKEAERLDRLRERVTFLEDRISRRERIDRKTSHYDRAELSALRWAIDFIETTEDYDDEDGAA
ncbi:hypothetical protein MWT96_20450 [Prescottella equi]|uniref:hypothetical protein n=1 Tax=Rhodococcus hoagii TaxID=43767 RepID=UPI001A0A60C9|nr:hypothetical protein [Prescottella equi]NKU46713.1 hypothetical protein [Prescottella equi]NKW26804.1 hypothetical protein [Prescottella equi]NKW33731.1 hypothetical protein [Prescottella equi]UPH36709.1 hypothetical protein GS533_001250 [Prescottella equi]UPH40840.1 hypothetical protein MWT96_20450 [Prescottella equi]